MAKVRARPDHDPASLPVSLQKGIERDLSQRDDDAETSQKLQLAHQIRPAIFKLFFGGLVRRRGAAYGRADITILELHSIVPLHRIRLAGKAKRVEGFIEPITASIPCEHPSGPVSAMGRGGEPHDEKPRPRIPESRKGLGPVSKASITPRRFFRHLRAPCDQTGTSRTPNDAPVERRHPLHRSFC